VLVRRGEMGTDVAAHIAAAVLVATAGGFAFAFKHPV
jgi:hypothetical protein